jgi:hypothetical protein
MHVITNTAEGHHDTHQLFLFFDPNQPISASKSTSWTGVDSDSCPRQATISVWWVEDTWGLTATAGRC